MAAVVDSNCLSCGLHSSCTTYRMSGQGPLPCDVMIVGEAPGAQEDEQGKPFVGRSGDMLNDMLDGIDWTRDRIRITNAVRCRPPGNATPTTEQIKACNGYLQKEIADCQPNIIITLGATALTAVAGRYTLSKVRGTVIKVNGISVVPTYHPAYGLRNPSAVESIAMDIALAFSLLDRKTKQPKLILVDNQNTLDRLNAALRNHKGLIALDIEGNSKNPFIANYKIPCYALAVSPDLAFCLPADHADNKWLTQDQFISPLDTIKANPNITLLMQNCYYDLVGIYNRFKRKLTHAIEDTILMAALLDENGKHDLDTLTALYCPELVGYSTDINMLVDEGTKDYSKLPWTALWLYNAMDTIATYRAFKAMVPKIKEHGLQFVYRDVMCGGIKSLLKIGMAGIPMDVSRVREANVKYSNKLRELHEQMLGMPVVRDTMVKWAAHRKQAAKHKTDYPIERYVEPFNPGSTEQKRILLFDVLGLAPLSKTDKTGKSSVDTETVQKYASKYKVCRLLDEYSKIKKLHGTYIAPVESEWLNSFDGFSHSIYKLHVARTGRTSASSPNHENVPRVDTNPDIKRFFVPRPGYSFVQMDYSQMELRVLACYSQDKELIQCYRDGLDVHKMLASYYYKIPLDKITKEQRTRAKSTNFGVIYGQGAQALAEALGISVREADGLIKSYFQKFSGVNRWMNRTRSSAHQHSYVKSLIGRIRHLPDIHSSNEGTMREAERQAVNSPIQGLASDMLLLRLNELFPRMEQLWPDVTPRAEVHDSVLFEVPIGQEESFVKFAKPIMEDFSMFDWCVVPVLTEWETGPNWGELKAIKL